MTENQEGSSMIRSLKMALIAIGAIIVFGACSLGGSTTTTVTGSTTSGSTTTGSTTTTSTATPHATATAPAVATCSNLLGGGVGAATAGSSFTDVPFPAGSLGTGLTLHHSGTGDFTIYLMNACTPSTSVAAIQSFFATQLPADGWAYSSVLPFNGSLEQACGDAYCWGKDANPRLVGLESVTNNGGGLITYRMRLFVPPSAPSCGVGFSSTIVQLLPTEGDPSSMYTTLPMPPLTHYSGGADTTPINGEILCSAGSQSSVQAFFTAQLSAQGWTKSANPTTDCSGMYYDMPNSSSPLVQCWIHSGSKHMLAGFFTNLGWYVLMPRDDQH
jgi:hypothetical protein